MHRRTAHRANAHPGQRTAHRARTARTDTPRSPLPETKRARAHAPITDQVSLTGRVAIRHNPPIQRYWHMGNNGIGILQTALLTYALGSILRYWSMRLQAYYGSVIVHYAPMRLRAYCKQFSIAITVRIIIILIENESQ
jgi:hypothetical protein